jgi:hypothetical protein
MKIRGVIAIASVMVIAGVGVGIWKGKYRAENTINKKQLEAKPTEKQQKSTAKETASSHKKPVPLAELNKNAPLVSAAIKTLVDPNGKERTYSDLLKIVASLGTTLSTKEVAELRKFLTLPNDQFPEKMRPIEINAVKNDVLDRLLRQETLPEGIGTQLAEMAGNAENDSVWRDYSIQFMPQFYERAIQDSTVPEKERTAVRDALFSALDERSDTLAGTALIGLELLSRNDQDFDRKAIVETAVEIAEDEMASTACRLTALRLTAMTEKSASAVDAARTLAQTGETVLLRSAAIVTLGETGTMEDRELIETYTTAENRQIAAAAKMALQKFDTRTAP